MGSTQNRLLLNGNNSSALIPLSSLLAMLLLLLLASGCAALIGAGAVAGIGGYTYVNGEVIRSYPYDHSTVLTASKAVLDRWSAQVEQEIIPLQQRSVLRAQHPSGLPVTININQVGSSSSKVGVRTGRVGYWHKALAQEIHENIDQRLNNPARTAKPGSPLKPSPPKPDATRPAVKTGAKRSSNAPAPASVQRLPKADGIVYFESNSVEIPAEAYPDLDSIAARVKTDANLKITITGFSDNTGPQNFNRMISELRAAAVKAYLVGKGIAAARITAKGKGPVSADASNTTETGRQLNRRVEVKVHSPSNHH